MMCDAKQRRHSGAGDQAQHRAGDLTEAIRTYAYSLGFDHCRFAPAETAMHADFLDLWLGAGRAGEMAYLERNVDKRRDPRLLTPEECTSFRSVIVLAVNYHQFELPAAVLEDPSLGIIASYAWAHDYHEIIRPLLYEIDRFIRKHTGRTTRGTCLVDTGPVLERDWAQRAGVGFTGKNCCTIHPIDGSWLFLAAVIVPERLRDDEPPRAASGRTRAQPSAQDVLEGLPPQGDYGAWEIPLEPGHEGGATAARTGTCGRCSRCLDACPTNAFAGPFHLDPLRCISYWTIESRQPIPRELRASFGNLIFGCDICQEVCPWNQRLAPRTLLHEGLRARQDQVALPLLEGFREDSPYWLNAEAFLARFRRSPLLRPKRDGVLRNVCVALGNWAAVEALPALAHAVRDPEPLARGHAAWALGRVAATHGSREAIRLLHATRAAEPEEWVVAEIDSALAEGAARS